MLIRMGEAIRLTKRRFLCTIFLGSIILSTVNQFIIFPHTKIGYVQNVLHNNITNNYHHQSPDIGECFSWENDNSDEWATHHPTWEVTKQNDTHLCFENIDSPRMDFLQRIYDNQWHGNCSNVLTTHMWSSGWGADFWNIADSLLKGLVNERPFQISFEDMERPWWHYSAMKDGSAPVCPTKDMFCYFLPLTNCAAGEKLDDLSLPDNSEIPSNETLNDDVYYSHYRERVREFWVQKFATRPQQYLRKRLYDFLRQNITDFKTPCVAMHVRRSDVILHGEISRKYYSISDYLKKIPGLQKNDNIFLLTDDANAIDETAEFHPEYHWMYLERKRHRGSEGGWENQIPSKNPALEVLYIMAEFELAKKCHTLVAGPSNYADLIHLEMKMRDPNIARFDVHDDEMGELYNETNKNSEEELKEQLERRKKKSLACIFNIYVISFLSALTHCIFDI